VFAAVFAVLAFAVIASALVFVVRHMEKMELIIERRACNVDRRAIDDMPPV
jgi:hypothetical protein